MLQGGHSCHPAQPCHNARGPNCHFKGTEVVSGVHVMMFFYNLQEFITINTGFLTFAMWVITGLCFAIVHSVFGAPFSTDLFLLIVMACTPGDWSIVVTWPGGSLGDISAIWLGRNKQILKDLKNYLMGEEDTPEPEEPHDEENDWGGIWVGNQESSQ